METASALAFLATWLAGSLRLAGPVLLAARGETFCERGGVLNIGIEGTILLGALASYLATLHTGLPWVGVLAAAGTALAAAMILGWFYLVVQASQVVVGIVFNLLSLGVASYVFTLSLGDRTADVSTVAMFPLLSFGGLADLPFIGPVLMHNPLPFYATLALVPLSHVLLFHTRFGLALRAVGENPQAAEAAGIPVRRMRLAGLMLSSFGAGLAGAYLVLVEVGLFRDTIVQGQGFIALAIVIFGRWSPAKAALAALVFGAADALQLSLQLFSVGVPPQALLALPYLVTFAAVSGVFGRAEQPHALMEPYRRG